MPATTGSSASMRSGTGVLVHSRRSTARARRRRGLASLTPRSLAKRSVWRVPSHRWKRMGASQPVKICREVVYSSQIWTGTRGGVGVGVGGWGREEGPASPPGSAARSCAAQS